MSKPICLVPARGGSKRFPRKNVAPLGGRPLLAWTVEPALASGVFAEVVVSSDDEEILAAAEAAGAVAARREGLAGDEATVEQVALEFALRVRARADALAVLLPTSPLRRPETIRAAWEAFADSGADVLFSVVPLDHPPEWALEERDGLLVPRDPEGYDTPRRRLRPALRHDGAYAFLRIESFLERGWLWGGRTVPFPTPPDEVADVDEPADLERVEFMLSRRSA